MTSPGPGPDDVQPNARRLRRYRACYAGPDRQAGAHGACDDERWTGGPELPFDFARRGDSRSRTLTVAAPRAGSRGIRGQIMPGLAGVLVAGRGRRPG